jgi:hypothetical protein
MDNDLPEDLAADGRPAGVEIDIEDREHQEPFDPEKISIDPKVVSMDALIRRLVQGSIRLAPAFQRKEIWNLERKSQLIESLMLNIPIPMFYVAGDERGNWDVVDGLQRLTAIKEFIIGNDYIKSKKEKDRGKGFKLESLEFWGDKYNRLTFNELPDLLINRILETEFRFTIINPGTPEEVKRNIFKRINTGGMPLTHQEIRHALYQGKSTKLLEELSESSDFKKATSDSVNDSRMAARELILRFLAFSIRSHTSYPKSSDMDKFLSDTMRLINIMPEMPKHELSKIFKDSNIPVILFHDTDILKDRFSDGMTRAYELFGKHCFRKSFGENKKYPINKTLFEVWGNLLADIKKDSFEILMSRKEEFLENYQELLKFQDFGNLISRDSWKYSSVQSRYATLQYLVSKYLESQKEE